MTALVYGLAVAGAAVVRSLTARGVDVIVVDDDPTGERVETAASLGVELLGTPAPAHLEHLIGASDFVSPAPGVPETHPVVIAARRLDVPLLSEIELAYRWEQDRPGGPRPMLAITGTDGKTTTTLLAVEMLRAAGLRTVDAGNTSTPLVDAIDLDVDAFVVECTSFRLAWTPTFRADAAVWLNLAPDHLNWHESMRSYEHAKARIFRNQRDDDVAIGFASDPVVMAHLATAPARRVTFGLDDADYRRRVDAAGAWLSGPCGDIVEVADMRRALPHDQTNALAASALVLETGLADVEAIRSALATFSGPAHRLEKLGEWDHVTWFNDSKATTPHAASAAIRSFPRIVLIAGGYDKGVDLSSMTTDADGVVSVIGIGDTGPTVAAAFAAARGNSVDIAVVPDLAGAVALAAAVAGAGDTVLLSPGCASFDQYPNFEARGEHFRSLVADLHAGTSDAGNDPEERGCS